MYTNEFNGVKSYLQEIPDIDFRAIFKWNRWSFGIDKINGRPMIRAKKPDIEHNRWVNVEPEDWERALREWNGDGNSKK